MTEHDHQVEVFDILKLNENKFTKLKWVYAVANGSFRNWSVGTRLKKEGVKPGVLDICMPFASANGKYVGGYIEMKLKGNTVSDSQKEFLAFIQENGYYGDVAWTADECLDKLEEYCGVKFRGRK
jgi:hypothetical protein